MRLITIEAGPVNYRGLMKKVEQVVAAMDRDEDVGTTIHSLLEIIIDKFRDELGIYGGRLYQRRGAYYVLQATFGDAKEVPQGLKVPISYRPIQLLLEEGTVYMERRGPRASTGASRTSSGCSSSPPSRWAARSTSWPSTSPPAIDRDDILFSLGILRHSVNQKIRRDRMEGIFEEARKIQASILPRRDARLRRVRLLRPLGAHGRGGRRLLRLHPADREDPRPRHRRRLRPRPARRPPGARHLHGPAHGARPRLQDRAHGRADEQHHPHRAR